MSPPGVGSVSAIAQLEALAASYDAVVKEYHLKISDVYVRSIADPKTAFQKPPHILKRLGQWFVRVVLRRKTTFTVSGVPLQVGLYDTSSNVTQIHYLFRSALQSMTRVETPDEKRRMLRIVQFALNADNLGRKMASGETSQQILREFLMGRVSTEGAPLQLEMRAPSSEQTLGQRLIDCVQPLAEDGTLVVDKLATLCTAVRESLSLQEAVQLLDVIVKPLRQAIEKASTIDEIKGALERGATAVQKVGIEVPRGCQVCGDALIHRLSKIAIVESDIPKLREIVDMIHSFLSKDQQRQLTAIIAKAVCTVVRKDKGVHELLNSWTGVMQQLSHDGMSIAFLPQDFEPLVIEVEKAWREQTRRAMPVVQDIASFEELYRRIDKEAIVLTQFFREQDKAVEHLVRFCPPSVRSRLEDVLHVSMGAALAELYQQIQERILAIVLPEVSHLKDRALLAQAEVTLRSLKAHLALFASEAGSEEKAFRLNQASLRMIDEALSIVKTNLEKQLVPAKSSTTHVLSHNVITINGVAQSAMMSALAMYAMPSLMQSFGVGGVASTIGLSLASPFIVSIGSAIVSPIGSFLDRQCEKLPESLRTPMKYIWRVGLTTASLYAAYRVYRGWTARTVVPVSEVPRPITAPIPSTTSPTSTASTPLQPADVCPAPGIASEDLGRVWSPDIQRQYNAAVGEGRGRQFLDDLLRQQGHGLTADVPSPAATSVPLSPPVAVPEPPPPLVAKGLWTRIQEAFSRGKSVMQAAHREMPFSPTGVVPTTSDAGMNLPPLSTPSVGQTTVPSLSGRTVSNLGGRVK